MVNPLVIKIDSSRSGLTQIDLPQFAGYEITVELRGVGHLTSDEYANLSTGGFRLSEEGAVFIEGEVYTVTALPKPIAPAISNPVYPFSQYPHTLVIEGVSATIQDDNGDWVNTPATIEERSCRAEPASGNAFYSAPDGTRVYYSFVVYMPLSSREVKAGTQVTITKGEETISRGIVKRYSRGQLNERVWL